MTMRAVLGLIASVGSTWTMTHEQHNEYDHRTIAGYDFNEYHQQLIKGDRLTADLKSPKIEVILFEPMAKTLTHSELFEIKHSGEQTLRLLMPRVFVR
jgi:hypothetical protein